MYTYGPVPSRRLGKSLGVSPIPPKTCSYSCVYCQLGRTRRLSIERESFFPKEEIFSEISNAAKSSNLDYVTFAGDGEPTLYADLGWLINQVKNRLHLPTAVITNGSLLYIDSIRDALKNADVVLPTLDAGTGKTFRHVNRPHRDINFEKMLQGQVAFRNEYSGEIWIEVMLVSDLNDSEEELQSIKEAISRIKTNRVYIATPIRPPAEPWVKPPSAATILRAQQLLGDVKTITDLESGKFDLHEFKTAREAILEIGSRHPLRWEQAKEIAETFADSKAIEQMLEDNKLTIVKYNNRQYLLPGHFIRGEMLP